MSTYPKYEQYPPRPRAGEGEEKTALDHAEACVIALRQQHQRQAEEWQKLLEENAYLSRVIESIDHNLGAVRPRSAHNSVHDWHRSVQVAASAIVSHGQQAERRVTELEKEYATLERHLLVWKIACGATLIAFTAARYLLFR